MEFTHNLAIPVKDLLDHETILCGLSDDAIIHSISFDSRHIQKGDWFICLKGEKFDGHDYVKMAIDSGAAGIIFDRDGLDYAGIKVADTTKFLGRLSTHWREIVNPTVIAITGSNGKTSVKELLSWLLEAIAPGKVCHSTGNYNNQFGVPYTLLSLQPDHKFLVVELGTNHSGEISLLSELAKPDLAIITSISQGHIGNFGSLTSIVDEKSDIVCGMKTGAVLIVNDDMARNPMIADKAAKLGIAIKTPDDSINLKSNTMAGIEFSFVKKTFHFPVCGNHQFQNLGLVNAALGIIISDTQVIAGAYESLKDFKHIKGRLQKLANEKINLWDDTYNANPASFEAAIKFFLQMNEPSGIGKYYGAFGMMGELGKFSETAHENLGRLSAVSGFTCVFFSAPDDNICTAFLRGWKSQSDETNLFLAGNSDQDISTGYDFLVKKMNPGDHLLVKGSRSTKMERIFKLFDM